MTRIRILQPPHLGGRKKSGVHHRAKLCSGAPTQLQNDHVHRACSILRSGVDSKKERVGESPNTVWAIHGKYNYINMVLLEHIINEVKPMT